MIGAALLWVGWYGFNVGSIVFVDGIDPSTQFLNETGLTFANTTLATMAAILGWLVVERLLHGKATSLGAASGIVAGLVAITPAAGAVNVFGASLIGAGRRCGLCLGRRPEVQARPGRLARRGRRPPGRRRHRHPDDRAVLGDGRRGVRRRRRAVDGLFYGGGFESLVTRPSASSWPSRGPAVATLVIALAIKYTIGWRISEEAEVDGIDADQHGESAYDLHGSLSGGAAPASSRRRALRPRKEPNA